jgi:hypothetical protein
MMPSRHVHSHVTYEKIAELFSLGMTYTQIADRLNCSKDTIFFRLRRARKDPEVARRDLEQRTCKCGRSKRPSFTACFWCRYGKPDPRSKDWDGSAAVQQLLQLVEAKQEADPCEMNVQCECGRRLKSIKAQACILCEGTSEELDQIMATERGISVEELRRKLGKGIHGKSRWVA